MKALWPDWIPGLVGGEQFVPQVDLELLGAPGFGAVALQGAELCLIEAVLTAELVDRLAYGYGLIFIL